ncbi:hypothetical protein BZM27_12695 [Paraburkholderia steynii]|uniref:Uncharacterized protein n=1 Tax=Paraburkholderia steynii TaxID=1245441 RepID=A0A4R0XHX9_9BURK|nr:hypothetical protein BZM27_12695 [Paraburkholderia steynii]
MSNSTTNLDQIATNQASKEVIVNALFDAASQTMIYGRRASTSSGLTWGYYGGMYGANPIANGTLTLTASATNLIYCDNTTGAVGSTTGALPAGKTLLYTIVTGTTTVSSYTDNRSYAPFNLVGGAVPYDMLMYCPGLPANNAVMARIITPRAVTLPASLTGSYASADVAATASTSLNITRNGSVIGSVNFAAGAASGTFTFASQVVTAPGDILKIVNQATADATLSNISVTLVGSR